MRGHELQPDDGHVHLRVVQQRDHGFAQQLGPRDELARHVHRVAGRAEGRHHAGQPLLRVGGQRGHGQAHLLGPVGHHHARATRLRGDAQAEARAGARLRERLQHVQHLLLVARAQHAVLADHGVEDRVFHGQRARVRGRGARARGHAPDLGQHQRLAQFAAALCEPHQAFAIGQAFEVAGRHANARILHHGQHELGELQVGLVARVDEVAQAQTALAHERGDGRAERAGLRDEGDRPRAGLAVGVLAEGGVDVLERVDEAQAVGAAQQHAGTPRGLGQALLERAAGLAHLAEARAEHHGRRHAARTQGFDAGHDLAGRHGHDGQVHAPLVTIRQARDVGAAGQARDLAVLGVDRQDGAAIALVDQVLERAAVDLGQVGRGADDGDLAWVDHARDGRGAGQKSCHVRCPVRAAGRARRAWPAGIRVAAEQAVPVAAAERAPPGRWRRPLAKGVGGATRSARRLGDVIRMRRCRFVRGPGPARGCRACLPAC